MDVLKLIDAIRESDPSIATIYKNGGCYGFYKLLKAVYPNAIAMINTENDHVVALINGQLYDIDGVVKLDGRTTYRAPEYKDFEMIERWSFAKNRFLTFGECAFCNEPLLISTT